MRNRYGPSCRACCLTIALLSAASAEIALNDTRAADNAPLVIPGRTEGAQTLNPPIAWPGALSPESTSNEITFRTLINGIPNPPEVLCLDEVTKDGNLLKQGVAELRDNGQGADTLEGDGFFATRLSVTLNSREDKKSYRLFRPVEPGDTGTTRSNKYCQEYSGEATNSPIISLPVTELPLKARASDPDQLIVDPNTKERFFANEVIVSARPEVAPERIEAIVDEIHKASKRPSSIVGFIPARHLYLLEIEGDGTSAGVNETIKLLQSREEIRDASPNHLLEIAASTYSPDDPRYPPPCTGLASECQYYMQTIRAREAWRFLIDSSLPEYGSDAVKVAVIDSGIDFTHQDLVGQRVTGSEPGDNSGNRKHGTQVAGLIAAKHNNPSAGSPIGIAGVSPGTRLRPYSAGSPDTWATIYAMAAATGSESKIINISQTWSVLTPALVTTIAPEDIPGLNANIGIAICDAIDNGRLVVVASGTLNSCPPNLSDQQALTYPAQWLTACPTTNPPLPAGYCDSKAPLPTSCDPATGMLAVGAIDNDGIIATPTLTSDFCSNAHPGVKIYAPGADIVTTQSGGGFDPSIPSIDMTDDGTSYAAPMVTGAAAALWAANPNWTARDVMECLIDRGLPLDFDIQTHLLLAGKPQADQQAFVGTDPRILDLYAAVNHAPSDIALSNIRAPQGVPGAEVGTLSAVDHCVSAATASDATRPDGVTYSVDNADFEIVANARLKLASTASLDYATDPPVTVNLTATDAEGLAYTESFTVNDKVCWPPHRGVPFNPNPPAIDGVIHDDVGWRGAHQLTFGEGTEPAHLAFQGLKDNSDDFIYLSFAVRNDPTFDQDDLIVINFRASVVAALNQDRQIIISPIADNTGATGSSCRANANTDGMFDCPPLNTQVFKRDGSGEWKVPVSIANLDIKVRSHSDGTVKAWYVELKVPTSTTSGGADWIDFADDFLFYFNSNRVDTLDSSNPTAVQFRWPRNSPEVSGLIADYRFPAGEWGFGLKGTGAQCNGLSFTWSDIGTTNSPASEILFDDPATTTPNTKNNTFVANVHNDANRQADNVRVRFRIANWGIPALGDWSDIPAANNPTNAKQVPAATSAGPGTETFNLDWIVPDASLASYSPPNDHQCILVEIESLSDANIVTKSVYRNMDFVEASKFERVATISARGYVPLPPGKNFHEFDLLVTATEVPEQKPKKEAPDNKQGQRISTLLWVANGYRHTGRYVVIRDNSYQLVDAVGSFGYRVSHAGKPVTHWQQTLRGAEQVAENLYRISIRSGEAMQVTTLIVPRERFDWLYWIVVTIVILIVLFVLVFRMKKSS